MPSPTPPDNSNPLPVTVQLSFDDIKNNFSKADDLQLRVKGGMLSAKKDNEGVFGVFTRGAQKQAAELALTDAFKVTTGVAPSAKIQGQIHDVVNLDGKSVKTGLDLVQRTWHDELTRQCVQNSANTPDANLNGYLSKLVSSAVETEANRAVMNGQTLSAAGGRQIALDAVKSIEDIRLAATPALAAQQALAAMNQPGASKDVGAAAFHALNSRGDITQQEFQDVCCARLQVELNGASASTLLREDTISAEFAREFVLTNATPYFDNVEADAQALRNNLGVLTGPQIGEQLLQSMAAHAPQMAGVQPFLHGLHQTALQNPNLGPEAGDRIVVNVVFLRGVSGQLTGNLTPELADSDPAKAASARTLLNGVKIAQTFASTSYLPDPLAVSGPLDQGAADIRQGGAAMPAWDTMMDQIRGPVAPVGLAVLPAISPPASPPSSLLVSSPASPPSSLLVSSPPLASSDSSLSLKEDSSPVRPEYDHPFEREMEDRDLDMEQDDIADSLSAGGAKADDGPAKLERSQSVSDMYKSEFQKNKEKASAPSLEVKTPLTRTTSHL
ncbi:hypothetical protein [Prosthecobacter dejongeii]|uniref:Uncharacterized protein n=1 Tax=Prosthecobacter dejongeii TaxID=48465 RepID=A0A7W7YMH5_9BACT|nr:hypothetical protein [Prosthecobacter dejongeii]MBB5038933.1 hypothetical protein [Prosthecobacter dejongeii]